MIFFLKNKFLDKLRYPTLPYPTVPNTPNNRFVNMIYNRLFSVLYIPSSLVMMAADNWWTTTNNSNNRQQWSQWTNRFKSLPNRWPTTTPTIRSAHTIINDDDNNNNDIDIGYIKRCFNQTVVKVLVQSLVDNTKPIALGTGFRLSGGHTDMMIVTNAHVVKGAHLVDVDLYYRYQLTRCTATVVYVERHRDLALVSLRYQLSSDSFPARDIDRSRIYNQGSDIYWEPVATVGHTDTPVRCSKLYQSGYVQTVGIQLKQLYSPGRIDLVNTGEWHQFIMHSSPANYGYSGGPLMTSMATVLGVTTLARREYGFYFATTNVDLLDFIEKSRQYEQHLSDRQLNRQKCHTLEPGFKLGLILSTNYENNTQLTIENIIPESLNGRLLSVLTIPSSLMAAAVIIAYNKWQTNSNSNRNQLLFSNGKRFQTNRFTLLLSSHPWPTIMTTIRSAHTIKDDNRINIKAIKFRCDQSVVKIMVPSLNDSQNKYIANGTGFRLNGNEMSIVTNLHVVGGSQSVQVSMYFYGGLDIVAANVVYVEPARDLALLVLNKPDKDLFHGQPFDSRTSTTTTNTTTADVFGEPVASIGHTQIVGEKSCQSGIILTVGITVDKLHGYGYVFPTFIDNSRQLLVHSAPILRGYSGGPALTADYTVIGAQIMGTLKDRFSFAITCNDILDFIENSKRYANGFNDRQLNRTVSYTLRPGLKLGLILLSNTIDDNNSTEFTIVNTIPESPNVEFIGQQIMDTTIRELANKLNDLTRDNNIISLTMRSMADTTKQSELMSMTAIDYNETNLPIIF
ncbi:uncharacterized protein LOC128954991 [Oppia nitens]|uniref:uncharacterized protein LOC128954991 n=1 Tax=Oppia nitens TaxID=1686743 RepID=UPI0023DA2AAF|nr:uncharacterized protein LOC128954991 [Oppia nitens]